MFYSKEDRSFWKAWKAWEKESLLTSSDLKAELQYKLRSNLKYFYQFFFDKMEPYTFLENWHVDFICEVMQGVYHQHIRRVIINVPPNMSKTGICSVAFTPFVWANNPSKRFIYGSQDEKLVTECSRRSRNFIQSKDYQKLFPEVVLEKDASGKEFFANTQFGYRLAVTVNAGVTGFRADIIVADDINDRTKVRSEALRIPPIQWLTNTILTRVQDKYSALVVTQQRTHPFDGSGYLLQMDNPDTLHVCLPMEFDETRKCIISFGGKTLEDPRKKQGELIWPARFDSEFCQKMRRELGEYEYATQYQQFPAPEQGGIFKKDDWHWHKIKGRTELKYIIQSWDTSLTDTPGSCFSVCTTWGIIEDHRGLYKAILLALWKKKVEYPDLRHIAQRLYYNYRDTVINHEGVLTDSHLKANLVLVEQKVSGFSLLADFNRAGINAYAFNPNKYGKKLTRARIAASLIHGGSVLLPCKEIDDQFLPTDYAANLVYECSLYSGEDGESNDVVDSMSQALIYMNETGWIYNMADPDLPVKASIALNKHLGT